MSKVKVGVIVALLGFALMGINQKRLQADSGTSGSINMTDGTTNRNTIFVYNEDGADHTVGSVLVYKTRANATYPGLSVGTTTTSNDSLFAGVVVERTLKGHSFGPIQTRGYCSALKVDAETFVPGNVIVTSTVAEKGQLFNIRMATGPATNEGIGNGQVGMILDNDVSSTTVPAVLFGR